MRKSIAAARICRPTVVRPRSSTSADAAADRDDDRDDRDLADVDPGDGDRPVQVDERRRRLAERVVALVDDERDRSAGRTRPQRSRRASSRATGAQRPEDDALHRQRERDHDREAQDDAPHDRPVAVGREREGAGHDELPVGEVDEPQHAEDEADAHGHQRVDRAEPDRVDESARDRAHGKRRKLLTRGTPPPSSRCRPRRRASGSAGPRRSRQVRAVGERDRALRALLDEQHA